MNIGNVFWNLPGEVSGFLNQAKEHLSGGILLRQEDPLPFRDAFWDLLCAHLGCQARVLDWGERTCSPGDFLLKHLFSPRERAYYFPGDPYGSYIASLKTAPLLVRVTGVRGSAAAAQWGELLNDYRRAGGRDLILFVECDASAGTGALTYRTDPNVHRYFSIMLSTILRNTPLISYQAELAANLAPGNPELCSELLLQGEQLLLNPADVGRKFGIDEQEAATAIRQANLVCLYPKIEQLRFDFVRANQDAISRCLPLRSMEGELIDNPMDLEIGPLSYLLSHREILRGLPGTEGIHLAASVRNKIAHNRPVPYATLLSLDRI